MIGTEGNRWPVFLRAKGYIDAKPQPKPEPRFKRIMSRSERKKHHANAVVMGFASLALFSAITSFQGAYNEVFPYYLDFTAVDPYDKNRQFDATITMYAKTYSAHSPIHVTAEVQIINGTEPDNLYILFPRSYQGSDASALFRGGWINATRAADGYYRGDPIVITYQMRGCYIVGITSHLPDNISKPINETTSCDMLNIGPTSETQTIDTNNFIIYLTYGVIALAVIQMRPFVYHVLMNYF